MSFKAIQSLFDLFKENPTQSVDAVSKALDGFSDKAKEGALNAAGIGEQMKDAAKDGANTAIQIQAVGNAASIAGAKATSFGAALKAAFFGTPLTAITTVISAIGLLTPLLDSLITTQEEIQQEITENAEAAKSAISESQESYSSLAQTVSEVKDEYAELKQGVDDFNQNQSLSTEGYERFLSINQQLADLFPELVTGYDENGNAILNLNGNVNTIVSSLEDLVDVQRKLAQETILENADDVFAGAKQNVANYLDEYNRLETEYEGLTLNIADRITGTLKNSSGQDFSSLGLDEWYEVTVDTGQEYGSEAANAVTDAFRDALQKAEIPIADVYSGENWDTGNEFLRFNVPTEYYQQISEALNQGAGDILHSMQTVETSIESEWGNLLQVINATLSNDIDWLALNTDQQNIVNDILSSISWEDSDWLQNAESMDDLIADIKSNIFEVFKTDQLTDEQKQSFIDLFSLDANSLPADQYLSAVQEALAPIQAWASQNGIELPLNFLLEDNQEIYDAYQNRISELAGSDERTQNDLIKALQERGVDTFEEMDYFMSVTEGAKSAGQALRMYDEAIQQSQTSTENLQSILNSAGDAFGNLNTAL